jgi:hypothetical protein
MPQALPEAPASAGAKTQTPAAGTQTPAAGASGTSQPAQEAQGFFGNVGQALGGGRDAMTTWYQALPEAQRRALLQAGGGTLAAGGLAGGGLLGLSLLGGGSGGGTTIVTQ